ncbi:MAG: hypothetical protein H6679_05235 [Epsilonproteobacteria bacterium]|nr:hypothetical protein [Campylobacterota bacterium]
MIKKSVCFLLVLLCVFGSLSPAEPADVPGNRPAYVDNVLDSAIVSVDNKNQLKIRQLVEQGIALLAMHAMSDQGIFSSEWVLRVALPVLTGILVGEAVEIGARACGYLQKRQGYDWYDDTVFDLSSLDDNSVAKKILFEFVHKRRFIRRLVDVVGVVAAHALVTRYLDEVDV